MTTHQRKPSQSGRPSKYRAESWWRQWQWWLVAALAGVAVTVIAVVSVAQGGGTGTSPADIAPGSTVQSFSLPDAITGQTVSLAPYLRKQDVVIVTLMGGF